MEKTYVSTID